MENIAFVIWMLGFPLVRIIEGYVSFLIGVNYSDNIKFVAAIVNILLYIFVALRLYDGH